MTDHPTSANRAAGEPLTAGEAARISWLLRDYGQRVEHGWLGDWSLYSDQRPVVLDELNGLIRRLREAYGADSAREASR